MMRLVRFDLAAAALALLVAGAACGGTIVYVDDDAPAGGDGSSWSASFRFLQDALSAAASSKGAVTEIHVAQGTYQPDRSEAAPKGSGDRAASFLMLDNLAIIGGYRGLAAGRGRDPDERNIAKYPTILSGDLLGDDGPAGAFANAGENSYHVVVALGVGDTSVLDGLKIVAGYADGPGFGADPASKDQGSGLNIYYASPMVLNCTFEGNWSANHGTINDHGVQSSIMTCTFLGNHAELFGAGLYIHHDAMTQAFGCQFTGNTTPGQGGGLYTRSMKGAQVSKCVFTGNIAGDGAGMYNSDSSTTTVLGCQFSENIAAFGAGMYGHFASPEVIACIFTDNESVGGGGGIWFAAGAPTVANCAFVNNSGANSGGLYTGDDCDAVITNCEFIDNTAEEGAGISNAQAHVIVSGCAFTGNSVAGGTFPVGGAMNNYICHPLITGCTFVRNTAELGGGAVYAEGDGPRMYNCAFYGNSANGENEGWGGAMMNGYTSSTLAVNCVFAGNSANLGGAVFNFIFSEPTLINCSIAGNRALASSEGPGGGIYGFTGSNALFANMAVWNNAPDGIGGIEAPVTYSLVQGGHAGEGNLETEPFFAQNPAPGEDGIWGTEDDIQGNLRPTLGSPLVDAGDNTAVPADIATDYDQQPRFADIAAMPDLGKPDGVHSIVDIGAFEQAPLPACIADIWPEPKGDGVVDQWDLNMLIDSWGYCNPSEGCLADITPPGGNSSVDVDDLILLITQWGGCR